MDLRTRILLHAISRAEQIYEANRRVRKACQAFAFTAAVTGKRDKGHRETISDCGEQIYYMANNILRYKRRLMGRTGLIL